MGNSPTVERETLPPHRVDWRRAFRAIQIMRVDPNRTDQVFELNLALDGGDLERQFQGMLAEPGGADLLREAPVLLDRLADFDQLESLAPDTLGAAYSRIMRGNGLAADGLRQAESKIDESAELHPGVARTWWAERGGCLHDLFHVVTGYGQDPAGETALLAFTDGVYGKKFRLRVIRFGLTASIFTAPPTSRLRTLVFSWQARRRGVRSRIPFSFRWEEALEQPLSEVRKQLGIAPAKRSHPRGMLEGEMEAPWSFRPHEVAASSAT